MTGTREGELLGLQWGDLDWTTSRVQVRHTLQWAKGGHWSLTEPKTAHSRRSIKLAPTAVQALRAHRTQQNEQRLAMGTAWDDHDLVFCNGLGRPIELTNMLHRAVPAAAPEAELPRIRFHDLRHTCATLLLLAGERPKVVQEMLGHGSIALDDGHILARTAQHARGCGDKDGATSGA